MDFQTYLLINCPLVFLNTLANAFYIFCMIRPLHKERIKQPLKLLLGTLVCCTLAYQLSLSVILVAGVLPESSKIAQMSYLVSVSAFSSSMTSSVWLSLFYYTQIVPAQRALFIWIKKNIKPIIYCIWLVERISSVFDLAVMFLYEVSFDRFGFGNNFTMDHNGSAYVSDYLWKQDMYVIAIFLMRTHFFFCLCVMVLSNSSTVVYLCRHMRRMVANGQSLSCPRFSGQARVAVTGIVQGVFYMFCALWTAYNFLMLKVSSALIVTYIHFTVINLYMSGTTFNLGAGQVVFRQRAADGWIRATRWCKTPKVQHDEQGG